jgi:hypothetical protein
MSNVKYILGGVFSLKCREKTNICQVKDDFLGCPSQIKMPTKTNKKTHPSKD